MPNLNAFFNPKTVAVIGASREKGKLGNIIFSNFVNSDFSKKGSAIPINPNADFILGKKSFKSILEVKEKIDLAVIVVPSKFVSSVLKECVQKNIQSVIIISAGFSELGTEEGRKLEKECSEIIKGTNTRIIGPNCLGIFDAYSQVDTLFLSKERCGRPSSGSISFISQSGAVGSTILDWLSVEGIGTAKFVSYGNAMDIDDSDLVEYLGKDSKTRVVMAYIEGIEASGKKFMDVCKKVSKKKPIVLLKSGKTNKGSKAASSHTGSLAGSGRIYSTAFKQSNVIEAGTWEELLDFSIAFATQPLPKGNRIAVITDGGGFGVLATDEIERQNLELPEPSEKLKNIMKSSMPSYVSLHNPFDLTGDADAVRYKIAIEECMKSKEYDAVIAITLFQVPTLGNEIIDYLLDIKKKHKKPLLICACGGNFTKNLSSDLVTKGIPVYITPERAVKAMKALVYYSRINKKSALW